MIHAPDSEFQLTSPLEIGSAMNELLHGTRMLHLNFRGTHVAVRLVAVDVRAGRFRFRPYGDPHIMGVLVLADTVGFEGASYSAQMRFVVGELRLVTPDEDSRLEEAVLEARLPSRMQRIQRREFFRALVTPQDPRGAQWQGPDGRALLFRIQDVSLAGIGLRAPLSTPALPEVGERLDEMALDFQSHGRLTANVEVVATHELTEFSRQSGNLEYRHIGCRFLDMDKDREWFLQRLILALERASRPR